MAKKPNDINTLNRFADHYLEQFHGEPDTTRLLLNLIADDLTDVERIRNYVIIEEYFELLRENNGISYLTLLQLAEKYEINEKQVQNIIYKWTGKYKRHSNIVNGMSRNL